MMGALCSFCQEPTTYANTEYGFEVGCLTCTKIIHWALGKDTDWIETYTADYMTFERKAKGCQWYLDGYEMARLKFDLCSQCGRKH
jgi:hypothetical protein